VTLDLDEVADELYGLVPAEFTSTRDARAAEARQSGDRGLAAAIKALKRPTSSAWLANALVRAQREQVEELLDLGSAMREAQEQFAGDVLRQLSQRRRQIVASLGQAARGLAREVGQPVSEQAERELETTLETALADPVAGDAVRSGRLTTALTASGLESLDLGGAMAPPPDTAPARPPSRRRAVARTPANGDLGREGKAREAAVARTPASDDLGRRGKARQAAELALLEAETAANDARREATELASRLSDAREEHGRLRQAVRQLEAQLKHDQAEAAATAVVVRDLERARGATERSATAAERRAELARRRLDRLRD
jgi:hypothetical protein